MVLDATSEMPTFAATVPGFVNARSDTKCVPLRPEVLTIPGIVNVSAEMGAADAAIKRSTRPT